MLERAKFTEPANGMREYAAINRRRISYETTLESDSVRQNCFGFRDLLFAQVDGGQEELLNCNVEAFRLIVTRDYSQRLPRVRLGTTKLFLSCLDGTEFREHGRKTHITGRKHGVHDVARTVQKNFRAGELLRNRERYRKVGFIESDIGMGISEGGRGEADGLAELRLARFRVARAHIEDAECVTGGGRVYRICIGGASFGK